MKTIDIDSVPRSQSEGTAVAGASARTTPARQHALGRAKGSIRSTHRKLYWACGVALVGALGFQSFRWYQAKRDAQAQDEVFQAMYDFEAGAFDKALNGDDAHKGLLAVAADYPHTQTGKLAKCYAGFAYMHQKAYGQAIACLSGCYLGDSILQARIWCVLGDAYSEPGDQRDLSRAAYFYAKAAQHRPNSVYSPGYLKKAAVALEALGKDREAHACYLEITQKYPKATDACAAAEREASRLSARF